VQFRDVFEVDGDAVRDRSDRLTKLFLNPSLSRRQAAQLMNESFAIQHRFHRAECQVPLVALMRWIRYQMRFSLLRQHRAQASPRGLPESPAFTLAADASNRFRRGRHADRDSGRRQSGCEIPRAYLVDPDTSEGTLTELVVEAKTVRSTFRVRFRSERVAGLPVPVEMCEKYTAKKRFYTLEGTATYSNFRQFSVTTVESVGEPASQR
jgi:hypothetical protein